MTKLSALRTINCRHNQITDKGIPGKIFDLEDLQVVVSLKKGSSTVLFDNYLSYSCNKVYDSSNYHINN